MKGFAAFFILFLGHKNFAQNPLKQWTDAIETHYAVSEPVINYILTVDSNDLSSFSVEIQLHNVPDTFKVAMVAHPEYDDRYWRFVKDLSATTEQGAGSIVRLDSALWEIRARGGNVVLRYRIELPPPRPGQRAAWRPFLSASGGLVGGPHSFMYLVNHSLAASHIQFDIPGGWQIATGLEPTADPHIFFAPSGFVLIDCPALIGKFNTWIFPVQGVPHRVIYWPAPGARSFDSSAFVLSIKKLVEQANILFGRFPYREYSFLFQDSAFGSLEHNNSVSIGIPSADLAADPYAYLGEIAHEYFHAWNIIRIHPAEYGDIDYHTPPYSKSLWWSEGLTMFYADLMVRRANLPAEDSSRVSHLEHLMERYYQNPGNYIFSAEKVSLSAYAPNGMLGDYFGSTHLQGELLGTMMDLLIRDNTNGKYSIDDAMRLMMEHFSGAKGFTGNDVEKMVASLCHCSMNNFFENYIHGNKPINFNSYLRLVGLKADTAWTTATDKNGVPAADLRVYAWQKSGESAVRVGITQPTGSWGKAGLHTGEIIKELNGMPVRSTSDFWQITSKIKTGDTVTVVLEIPVGVQTKKVIVSGYQQPQVHISALKNLSGKQQRLYVQWAQGK